MVPAGYRKVIALSTGAFHCKLRVFGYIREYPFFITASAVPDRTAI